MKLSPRQEAALRSICDTFAPASDGWPSANELGVPETMAELLDYNPRQSSGSQFRQLLDLWDSRWHSLFAAGKFSKFSTLDEQVRTRVLLDWAGSSMGKRRAAFQALRKGVGFLYVMLQTTKQGQRNPVWSRIGYPGPIGAQRPGAARSLRVLTPDRDSYFSCDVCIVGSGAGGGTAAGVLAVAGEDVIVLEAGHYYDDADFDGAELGGYERLYTEAGATATQDQSVGLLAGECLGGGTVVNYTTSFRTPDDIRAEWSATVPWFSSEEYTRSLDTVFARLSVNRDHNQVSRREQIVERGLRALGWHVDRMPRNVTHCDPEKVCGSCGYGCPIGSKQSTAKTWLADAQAHGARLITGTRAERVTMRNGAATGVEARTKTGHRVTVRCKAVVVACGSIQTPALLRRSGLSNPHIGQHLRLHPVSNVCGVFDEEIRPWEGTLQAIYSDEHKTLNGNFGVKYETTALQPSIAVAALPWTSPAHYRSLLEKLRNTCALGVLLRDRDGGRVTVDGQGHPIIHYSLSSFDRANLRSGFLGAARILEAAGARLIYSPHAKWSSYEPNRRGSLDSFAQQMDAAGWDNGRLALFSFHIMGTARLGSSAQESALDPQGQTWEAKKLYVMDAACFPSASGVNPMITIEAIAHRNASALAASLYTR
jgi:choline dehydrogenase-like flavoprotein